MTSGPESNFEDAAKTAADRIAEFRDEFTPLERIQDWLHRTPWVVPVAVLVLAIIFFGLQNENFFKASTLSTIMQQIAVVGILGCAQTLVVLTAGIDLSVGAIAVFSSVLMGQFTFRYGVPPVFAVCLGLAFGTAIGAINGFLVARVKLPPFIVTLGTWQIVLAANYIYSANETIRSSDIAKEAPILQFWGKSVTFLGEDGVANSGVKVLFAVFLLIALVAFLGYVLKHTAWGRHVYAVGDDLESAALAGVPTTRILIQTYAVAGLICAIAGWVMIGRFGSVSPSASTGMQGNIQSITAVVIGGISLFGGRGRVTGMFLGALIVGVFELGLKMIGTDPQWTYLLIGALIIGAVAIDQWIRKA